MKNKIVLAIVLFTSMYSQAQDIKTTINEVISTNPIILERLKNYNATKEDINSAKAGFYPKVDLNLGIGYEQTSRENLNTKYNVYQNSIKYTQNLFNGFSTTYQIKEQEYRTLSAAYSYIEKVNSISFDMLSAYIEVMKNQELLKTAKKNVKIDEDILDKVQKLYDSGLTTLSEVNKIESSLALAKSNLIVQENNILDASYNLQRILGRALNPDEMSKPNDIINLPSTKEEAILFAMKNNPSLLVSQYNVKLAQATYKKKKSPFYPQIDIELSQSMNKNLSAIRGEDDRFRAMVYLSYNIFNGFADKTAIQKSISGIHQEVQIKETLKRKVIEALSLAWAANKKLNEQLKYLIEYKDFSFKTLKLYTKEYDLGRRSLLDLLSAQNDFIRAKEQIITTEYSLLFAKYRILDAMGILVSTIMEGKKIIYNNVNISQQIPQSKDILPIRYDRDKDLIVDEMDICSNSLTTQMKNIYGCELIDDNISQIQRYDEFLFEKEGMKKKSKIKLQNLIKQLSEHNIKNMKFEIVANAQYKDKTKKELFELSKKRAEVIKNEFLKAGVPADKIKTYANADDAPLYSDYDARNNRVDIIVKKLK